MTPDGSASGRSELWTGSWTGPWKSDLEGVGNRPIALDDTPTTPRLANYTIVRC